MYSFPITIGDNVWLGANVVVLPDVTIGENSVIGAGSIVTKDIPANCIAFGSPCKVYREINEHDKEYYFKNHRFDETAINEIKYASRFIRLVINSVHREVCYREWSEQ